MLIAPVLPFAVGWAIFGASGLDFVDLLFLPWLIFSVVIRPLMVSATVRDGLVRVINPWRKYEFACRQVTGSDVGLSVAGDTLLAIRLLDGRSINVFAIPVERQFDVERLMDAIAAHQSPP